MHMSPCPNSGLALFDCSCFGCVPNYFQLVIQDIPHEDTVEIKILGLFTMILEYYSKMKKEGYDVKGSLEESHIIMNPPKREGFYWGRCMHCGYPYELPIGESLPISCERCR